jgi:transporter family protein
MNNKAFFFAILTALIWGLAPAFEKVGLGGRIDPYLGVVIRTVPIALVGVLGLALMGRLDAMGGVDLKSVLFVMTGGFLAGFVGQVAFYSALKSGEASVVVPLAATYPLVALVISVLFLGEAFTWQKLGGIFLIVGGVVMLK